MDVYWIAFIIVAILSIIIDVKKSGRRDPPD